MTVESTSAKFFVDNKWILLNGALPEDKCLELSNYLRSLVAEGKASKDEQCPKSFSVYGDEILDGVLDNFKDAIGSNLGLELLPTYSYARVYQKGEVLEPHIDRESCEISGTLTLGFDGTTVWPIYVGESSNDGNGKRIDLGVGDILMYRGEEVPHWRNEFKGEWQCQVFFHYIDANGPHAGKGLENDGRPKLGTVSTENMNVEGLDEHQQLVRERLTPTSTETGDVFAEASKRTVIPYKKQSRVGVFPIFNGIMIPSWDLGIPGVATYSRDNYPNLTFSVEECRTVIGLSEVYYPEKGSVGVGGVGEMSEIRVVDTYNIPLVDDTKWIFDRIARVASLVNNEHYNFDIMGITHDLQLLHYKTDDNPGHYDWHIDMGSQQSATRKISMSVQLSEEEEYTGGELVLNNNGQYVRASKERGCVTCFPSYFLHKVVPMTSGDRWAIVIWVHGSSRFR